MRRALSACALAVVLATLMTPRPAAAHEPIFSIGPRVIWRDGLGLELELERQRIGAVEIWALNYEILYGLTANQAFTIEVPQVLDKGSPFGSNSGLGDVLLRYKWRFFKKDVLGGSYQAAVLGGVELSTGEYGVAFPTGVWFTYRNHAFKPGIQIPIYVELNGGATAAGLESRVRLRGALRRRFRALTRRQHRHNRKDGHRDNRGESGTGGRQEGP